MAGSIADCDFCSFPDNNLGVQNFVKVTEKLLRDILKEESGDTGKKTKQKIGHKLMSQNDKQLIRIFNLGEGFQNQKFNNLALDKLRKDRDNAHDLGKLSNFQIFKLIHV